MNFPRRRNLVLIFGLLLGLAVIGRWAMLAQEDAGQTPVLSERPAPLDETSAQSSVPAVTKPAASGAPEKNDVEFASGIFRGRVIDAVTHKPVREFELQFHDAEFIQAGGKPADARKFRAADGRFQWRDARAGSWKVIARATGYQRFELSELQVSSGETTPELVLPMRRGHTLRGRVYDTASGAGIAAARVRFRESHVNRYDMAHAHNNTSSQQDGSFVADGVPEGRVTFLVHAQGYAEREVDVVVGEKAASLDIGLSVGGTISGYLAAADGLTPIAGIAGLTHLDDGYGTSNETGDAGEFEFPHLPAGRYRLTGNAGGQGAALEVTLGADERLEGIVLAVNKGRSIRGFVSGYRREQVKHAAVFAHRAGDGDVQIRTIVDARGAYALHGVGPGRVRLMVSIGDRQFSKTVDMPADQDLTVNLELPPGVRLTGRVTHAGKPLPNEAVAPRPLAEQSVMIYGTSTSQQGEYAVEGLPVGEYYIYVGSYRSPKIRVSSDTVFDIDVPGAQLSGRLVEADSGAPVVSADVFVWSAQPDSAPLWTQSRTDHFGRFALVGLEPGDFVLSAYKPGYEMHRAPLTFGSPASDTTIPLRRAHGAQVKALDADGGRPPKVVHISETIGARTGSQLMLDLDENGVGYIPSALEGSTLSFMAFGYLPTVVRDWNGQSLELQLHRQVAR